MQHHVRKEMKNYNLNKGEEKHPMRRLQVLFFRWVLNPSQFELGRYGFLGALLSLELTGQIQPILNHFCPARSGYFKILCTTGRVSSENSRKNPISFFKMPFLAHEFLFSVSAPRMVPRRDNQCQYVGVEYIIQLSLEGEVNSGGNVTRREESRYISISMSRPWGW